MKAFSGPPIRSIVVILLAMFVFGCQLLDASKASNTRPQNSSLVLNTSVLDFGSVVVGTSETLPVTVENTTSSAIMITEVTASHAEYSLSEPALPVSIPANQSITLNLTFTPTVAGNGGARISISSNLPEPPATILAAAIAVDEGHLTANPASLDFGVVKVGGSQTITESLTNASSSTVRVLQATLSGAGFQMSPPNMPVTLTAGQSMAFSVTFSPQTNGAASGTIVVTCSYQQSPGKQRRARETMAIVTSGTGSAPGQLGTSPASLNFGNVQVGNNQKQSATLTNTGGSTVSISQATISGTGFSLSGISAPLTLAANQSTTFSVTFAPQANGNASGTVTIVSDAQNTSLTVPLSGAGVSPGALTANPSSLSFGTVQVGSSQTLSETLTNSGGSSVTISQATPTGAGLSVSGLSLPLTLTAGQSKTFSVVFAPLTTGAVSGNLAVVSNGSNPTLNIPLSGTGAAAGLLSANPTSIGFGSVQVSNSSSQSETLTNTGGSSVTISQATATGSGFGINGLTPPVTLTPGQSYTFTAIFAPTSAGAASGNISVVSNGSNPNLTISLSGTGTAAGQLSASPATLSFGNVTVGTSKDLTGTLSATGSSVTVSAVGVSSSEFALSGISLPVTIGSGQNAPFTVTFTPQASGSVSATASFVSNASNSPTVQSLTGTGTAPPTHGVDLSWSASISPVTGYNVYRGGKSSGPYTKINSPLDLATSYTDTSVVAGQTYYYVTTAVDSDGMESTYSNEVQAVVPTP